MIQSTLFGSHSRFHWDFHNDIDNKEYWEKLAFRYEESHSTISMPLNRKARIPKSIHQIWLGPNAVPSFYSQLSDTWKRHNPDFTYRLWTDNDVANMTLRNQHLFDSLNNYGAKSDLLRYEILMSYGGVYIDVDFECISPLPSSLFSYEFVAGLQFSHSPEVGNAFLMSEPGCKIIDQVIASCTSPKYEDPFEIFKATGPYLVSKVIESCLDDPIDDFVILPSNYVYPLPSFLSAASGDPYVFLTNESFAIHYWNLSWLPKKSRFGFKRNIKKVVNYIRSCIVGS